MRNIEGESLDPSFLRYGCMIDLGKQQECEVYMELFTESVSVISNRYLSKRR